MQVSFIHPPEWKAASGYSNGVLVTDGGPQLFLAGQIAWNANQEIVGKEVTRAGKTAFHGFEIIADLLIKPTFRLRFFELLDRGPEQMGVTDAARRVEVVCSPGVSALQGAAARAGAPLGHDFCAISLSDLLTPREDIVKRLKAAAEGDFVIAFYNPVSMRRRTLLAEARDILLEHRPADTPVMLASSLGRPEEFVRYRRLDELQVDEVDMLTVVLIGSSHSKLAALGEGPRMYTPRGYARKIDGDLSGA